MDFFTIHGVELFLKNRHYIKIMQLAIDDNVVFQVTFLYHAQKNLKFVHGLIVCKYIAGNLPEIHFVEYIIVGKKQGFQTIRCGFSVIFIGDDQSSNITDLVNGVQVIYPNCTYFFTINIVKNNVVYFIVAAVSYPFLLALNGVIVRLAHILAPFAGPPGVYVGGIFYLCSSEGDKITLYVILEFNFHSLCFF